LVDDDDDDDANDDNDDDDDDDDHDDESYVGNDITCLPTYVSIRSLPVNEIDGITVSLTHLQCKKPDYCHKLIEIIIFLSIYILYI
jgi:hypothetical protein